MTAPQFVLPVTGTDPKSTTKQLMENAVNAPLQTIWDAAVVAGMGEAEADALRQELEDFRQDAADAVTAADIAATGAKYFDTISAGRSAVADTETFGVKAGGSDGLTRPTLYRRDSSSTQTKITEIVTGTELDAKAAQSTLDARVDVSRPMYLSLKQVAAAAVASSFAVISGAWLDGTAFAYDQQIGVSNGLVATGGALNLGTQEGSLPLSGGSVESARPMYLQTLQVVTASVDGAWHVMDATYLSGQIYGQDATGVLPLAVLGDSLGDELISALATYTGRTVIDLCIGGQVEWQCFYRFMGFTARSSTDTIASGSNSVTHINGSAISGAGLQDHHMVLSTPADTTTRSITGVWGSIRGAFQRSVVSTVETYAFIPDAGQTLPVTLPDDTPFIPDTLAYLNYPLITSIGRNGSWTDGDIPDVIQRIMNIMPHRNIIVMEVPNSDGNQPNEWGPSGTLYLQIKALNAAIQKIAGPCYVPVSRILKDRGLALAGLTPNAQDVTDKANDVESNQLRADSAHRNTAGETVIARDILAPIIANWN